MYSGVGSIHRWTHLRHRARVNACGPAIVTEELLCTVSHSIIPHIIYAIDAAPAMFEAARSKLVSTTIGDSLRFDVMQAGKLSFSDDTFANSFTNLGILFFADGVQAAKEIFRTLRPGCIATVTSWADLGYLDIVRKAQAALRPDAPQYSIPINESWFSHTHIEDILRAGEFTSIEVHEKEVHMGASSFVGVCELLSTSFHSVYKDWDTEEQASIKAQLLHFSEPVAVIKFQTRLMELVFL